MSTCSRPFPVDIEAVALPIIKEAVSSGMALKLSRGVYDLKALEKNPHT